MTNVPGALAGQRSPVIIVIIVIIIVTMLRKVKSVQAAGCTTGSTHRV
jgi:hypothetical protein